MQGKVNGTIGSKKNCRKVRSRAREHKEGKAGKYSPFKANKEKVVRRGAGEYTSCNTSCVTEEGASASEGARGVDHGAGNFSGLKASSETGQFSRLPRPSATKAVTRGGPACVCKRTQVVQQGVGGWARQASLVRQKVTRPQFISMTLYYYLESFAGGQGSGRRGGEGCEDRPGQAPIDQHTLLGDVQGETIKLRNQVWQNKQRGANLVEKRP